MAQLDIELRSLVKALVKMTKVVIAQMQDSKQAYLHADKELAAKVLETEEAINAMELTIDKDCENIIALYNPVASDLRLVIASLKIISDLERIGDYADGISKYVIHSEHVLSKQLLKEAKVGKMFDVVISMLEDIKTAIVEEDTKLARKVYNKDKKLNKINKEALTFVAELIKGDKNSTEACLNLYSAVRKLERAGDHIKNIAEDLVFYVEVVVLRHKDNSEN